MDDQTTWCGHLNFDSHGYCTECGSDIHYSLMSHDQAKRVMEYHGTSIHLFHDDHGLDMKHSSYNAGDVLSWLGY